MKQTKTNEKQNNVKKKKLFTISKAFQSVLSKGAKNMEEDVTNAQRLLNLQGIKETSKGNPVDKKLIARQFKAMLADIKKERKGWWSKFSFVEDKDCVKLIVKAPVA